MSWTSKVGEALGDLAPMVLAGATVALLVVVLSHKPVTSAPPPGTSGTCTPAFVGEAGGACRQACDITGIGRLTWDGTGGECHAACECMQVPNVGVTPIKKHVAAQ